MPAQRNRLLVDDAQSHLLNVLAFKSRSLAPIEQSALSMAKLKSCSFVPRAERRFPSVLLSDLAIVTAFDVVQNSCVGLNVLFIEVGLKVPELVIAGGPTRQLCHLPLAPELNH
jgi:hypothetical protein